MLRSARIVALLAALGALILPAAAQAVTGPAYAGSVANSTTLSSLISVAVSGNYAFTTAYHPGQLTAVDISNPSSPFVAGSTPSDTGLIAGSNVAISGNDAFVVSKNRNASTTSNDDGNGNSLTIVDISNPTNPTVLGEVRDTSRLFGGYGVAVQGNYAYVAYQGVLAGQPQVPDTSHGGFTVVDITNPASPTIVANIDNSQLSGSFLNGFDHATSVAISGHYAYVNAFYAHRITVVDISNPKQPQVVDSLTDATNLTNVVDLAVQGQYLYAAAQVSGTSPQLAVLDISNPTAPTVIGTLSNSSVLAGAYRIRVNGDFVYESAHNGNAMGAIDVSNPRAPRLAGYFQSSTFLAGTSGLDLTGNLQYVVTSSPELSTQSNSAYPPYPFQAGYTGTGETGTITLMKLDPNPIAVTISPGSEPPNPTLQTSANFSFSTNDNVSAVQCSLDGAPLGTCTSPTAAQYAGLAVGSHTFTVEAIDSAGNTNSQSYTWTVGTVPATGGQPTISDASPTEGEQVTASNTWTGTPSPTVSYQWNRCDQGGANCQPISGATGQAYVVQQGDVSSTLEVTESASNGLGSPSPASSAATAIVQGPPENTGVPQISGTAAVGSTLSGTNGTWTGYPALSFQYQWTQCAGGTCTDIVGATNSTYKVQSSDTGTSLELAVTASNALKTATAISAPVAVGLAPVDTVAPGISGTTTVGSQLSASQGSWSNSPTSFSYQWQRCDQSGQNCSAVGGASSSNLYTLAPADAGSTIAVTVTASNSNGQGQGTSTAVGPVTEAPQNTSGPTVSGTTSQGQTLTASPGNWSAYPGPSFTYVWQRCTSSGCSAISGATAQTYVLARADVGNTVRVVVTASNGVAPNGSATSAAAGPIVGPPVNTVAPKVTGSAVQGTTLTGTPGTWTGYPTPTLSLQWVRCNTSGESCTNISGATAKTYTLAAADVGDTIRLYVRGTNSAGSLLARSAQTAVVQASATGSAVLGGVANGSPQLKITARSTPGSPAFTRLTVSLPAGMSFARQKSGLTQAVRAAGHVRFAISLRHGALVIVLRQPARSLTLIIGRRALAVAHAVRAKTQHNHRVRLKLTLTIGAVSGLIARDTVDLRVS